MEEATSWKNHSFTLLVFGGIVVLCSIFFALGMVVGRHQGRHIAQVAYAEKAEMEKVPEDGGDPFPLDFYKETVSDKPDLNLQPAPRPEPSASKDPSPSKESKPAVAKTASSPVTRTASPAKYLQVYATANEKQALEELKKVKSMGFKAMVLPGEKGNVRLSRVVVGPYKESEISLAKKDLEAKGYKGVFVAK